MTESYNKAFKNTNFRELLYGLFNILLGVYGLVGVFNDIYVITIFIKIVGVCFIISGFIRLLAGLFKKNYDFQGIFYCHADDIGLYGNSTNNGFMILAWVNYLLLLWANIVDVPSAAIPMAVAVVFSLWTAYGALYRRSRCIIACDDKVIFSKWNNHQVIQFSDIKSYTDSKSFGGYKALDQSGATLFRWSKFWGEGKRFCDYLDSHNINYR